MGYFADAGMILIEVAFGLAVALFVLRVLLQLVRANFYNPVCQFFYRATNPILTPMRRVLKPWRNVDLAACLIAYLLECLKVVLLMALVGRMLSLPGVLLFGFAELIAFLLGLYFWLILVRIILSFVGPSGHHPVVPLIGQITEPVLRPVRRLLPTPGGLDFSPMLVMLAIVLARILIVAPLRDLALHLSQG